MMLVSWVSDSLAFVMGDLENVFAKIAKLGVSDSRQITRPEVPP